MNGSGERKPFQIPVLSHILGQFVQFFETLGKYALFFGRILAVLFKRPYRFRLFFDQFEKIGAQSVGIIALSSLAIGMIFTLQIIALMARFQAEVMVGAVVASTLARELAPVITTLMLIAKNGSSMTAEIGTMKVTEQIDAMETMSVDPVHYLVVPRVYASILAFPILTGLANVVGILGSFFVAVFIRSVDPGAFLDQLYRYIDARDIYSGLIKAAVMGLMVASICSYFGFITKRGSRGVGEAATTAVVTSSVSILIADYIMSDIMIKVFYNIKFAV